MPREHWATAGTRARTCCLLTAGCPAFRLPPLHYRFGMIVLPDAHQNPGSRRYHPANRAYRRGRGSADRFGQQVRAKLVSGFLATATIRCRNRCELVSKRRTGIASIQNGRAIGKFSVYSKGRTTPGTCNPERRQRAACDRPCSAHGKLVEERNRVALLFTQCPAIVGAPRS